MQFAKEDIKNRILSAAREEFLCNGFEKASIRHITSAAQTSKSNLYNYFNDKDALFVAVLEPTLQSIMKGLELAVTENEGTGVESYTMDEQVRNMRIIMDFVANNTGDIRLLLFHSAGSSLAGFKDMVIERFSDILSEWLKHAMPQKSISRLFVRCVAGFYVQIIEQLTLAGVDRAQAEMHMAEFLKFIYSGWAGMMHG